MKGIEDSKHFYDRVSTVYNPLLNWVFNPGRQKVADVLNTESDLKIIEIGSGTGTFVQNLKPCNDYLGIEASVGMYNISKRNFPANEFLNIKYEDYQPSVKFDVVVINYTLSVVDDPEDLIKKVHEWLGENGRVYIVNHFSTENLFYKLLQKVSIHFGYNAYFPFNPKLFSNYFNITIFESVNLLGIWKLIELTPKKNEQE